MNPTPIASTHHLNRNSGLPLYLQIYEALRRRITSNEWQPGDLLPTESILLEQYQVSRATVRQALDELVQEGLIYRERGRGTFVAHPTVEQGLVRIVSFTEDMRQRGFQPGTEVLVAELVAAQAEQAKALGIRSGEELAHIKRLRLADGEPMSIEDSYLVHQQCPGILDRDYALQPLRATLEQHYGIHIDSATQSIRAINAAANVAERLGVRKGAALLFIERVSRSQYEIPVEYLQVYHRGDRYVLYNELRG